VNVINWSGQKITVIDCSFCTWSCCWCISAAFVRELYTDDFLPTALHNWWSGVAEIQRYAAEEFRGGVGGQCKEDSEATGTC